VPSNEPKNRHVLVVDDSPQIHEDFRKVLGRRVTNAPLAELEGALFGQAAAAREWYHLDSACRGEEALAKVRERLARGERYALAIVDMRMPEGWDGVETVTKLWEADPDIQVIICTAHADHSWDDVLARLGEQGTQGTQGAQGTQGTQGANDRLLILRKPFDRAEVRQLAGTLTEKWRLARQADVQLGELRLAEERIRHDAFHDALTGLANRALLLDRLEQCLLRSKRNPQHRFAVLFADLDDFNLINDSLGHAAGDQLLVDISRRLLACIRATDSIAQIEQSDLSRLGGDEFVVLLDGMRSDTDVLRVAKRLQEALTEPFLLDGREVFTGMSVGVAVGRPEYERPEDILRDAHTALYRAKARGRGGCEFFDNDMRAKAMSRWWLENALRRAIDRRELRLVYQPIVAVQSGELRELEALLRWRHPERGAISPAEFIPVAEETGLILPLGDWVLREAIGQLGRWGGALARRPDFALAVNLSGKQLSRPDLGGAIAGLLAEAAIPGQRLRLEVTESALMEEKGVSANMPARLMELDVRLQLDDFGTGYSSLSYLHQLPVDALKIDRSFVQDMTRDATCYWIVQSIIALAHALGAEVIAEGVETRAQLEELRALECDLVQGFYISRPVEVDQATALLEGGEILTSDATGDS
jgi:diguanylate cyclase (GGDEF)-like protein